MLGYASSEKVNPNPQIEPSKNQEALAVQWLAIKQTITQWVQQLKAYDDATLQARLHK